MRNLFFTLIFILFSAGILFSQEAISVGKASYAAYPPTGVVDFRAYIYSYRELKNSYPFYLHENMIGQPVPTNDWWTDAIFSQYAGDMWAYPHGVSADSLGIDIIYPDGFDGGKLTKTNFLKVKGSTDGSTVNFAPHSAKPYNWGDLNLLFRCEDNNNHYMDVSISHGSPFVWVELKGIEPVLTPGAETRIYDTKCTEIIDFPARINAFSIQVDNKYYGVHAPAGTTVKERAGSFFLNVPSSKNYVVISVLPGPAMLETYDTYARNKLTNTTFRYDYDVSKGQVSTTFIAETENLDNKVKGNATMISFLPHHYRNTTHSLDFINGADYALHLGKMHTATGNEFTFNYSFTGMPSHLGAPKNMTAEQTRRLSKMVTDFKISEFNSNTYNKTLDELSEMMLIARQIGHPRYEYFKKRLKEDLIQWLTYDKTSETDGSGFFFAQYPDYGALIGFPSGFDSQAFNDLHYHYGYYVLSAARLMMVDEDFKTGYSEIIKLIVKTFANRERWNGVANEQKYPFLRTFDPYAGHSWAGGVSDALGSNQESTSEAVMSWFGIFNLGLALNDASLIAHGAMGYKLETEAALEYWFDIHGDNFPLTYKQKYVGILRAGELIDSTWFSNDPAWILGIQCVPNSHYCSYLSRDPEVAKRAWHSCLQSRVNTGKSKTADIYTNILDMGSYLGTYHLGYYATWNPKAALELQDKLYKEGAGEWKWGSQSVINYYITNATITYGVPAKGYHTSLPAGTVYENEDGDISYLLYNHTKKDLDVKIYKNGKVVRTIPVKAGEYCCK